MNYYVRTDGGDKYGPADQGVLHQWANEGRLTPATIIEDEYGRTFYARDIVKFKTHTVIGQMPTQPAAPVIQPGQIPPDYRSYGADRGQSEATIAYILFAIGLVLSWISVIPLVLGFVAMGFGLASKRKGHLPGIFPATLGAILGLFGAYVFVVRLVHMFSVMK